MGEDLSTSFSNPSLTPVAPTMSSPPSNPQNPDPKSLENQNPDPKTIQNPAPEVSDQPSNPDETSRITDEGAQNGGQEGEGEEEEEGECGFCLFMKGGGCKDEFIAWEQCVEQSEKNNEDIVEKCAEITGNLKKCMEAHSDYYEPLLRAEKAAEEEVNKEMEREAAATKANNGEQRPSSDLGSKAVEERAEIEVQREG